MTNADSNRLDRIEALLESIATDLAGAKDIAVSNAKAIAASRDEFSFLRREWQLDRSRLYRAMADLAQSQADLAQAQAQMSQTYAQFQQNIYQRQTELDTRQGELSRRQGEIVEILKILTQRREQE